MEERLIGTYYTTSYDVARDLSMRLAGVEGPMRSPFSQAAADFAGRSSVRAYVERQWHPGMMENDSTRTTVFEVAEQIEIPVGLRNYS